MEDLEQAKQILGMRITLDRSNKLLWLSQERYIEKVLEKFNIHKVKPVNTLLVGHFKLSSKQSPTNEKEIENKEDSIFICSK